MSAPVVLFNKQYYALNNKGQSGEVGSDLNPQTDYAQNGNNATWVLCPKFQVAILEAVFAAFAKLGSAIFSGDFMMSQHGVNKQGEDTTNYETFNPESDDFTPNILMNFLTGYSHFAKGNVVFNMDGSGSLCNQHLHWDKNGKLYRRREIGKEYVYQDEVEKNNGIIGPGLGSFYTNQKMIFSGLCIYTLDDPAKWVGEILEFEQIVITRTGGYYRICPAKSGQLTFYDDNLKAYVKASEAHPHHGDSARVKSNGSSWVIQTPDLFTIVKE